MGFNRDTKKTNRASANKSEAKAETIHENREDANVEKPNKTDGTRRNRRNDDLDDRRSRRERRREDNDRDEFKLFSDDELVSIGEGGDELNSFVSVGKEVFENAKVRLEKNGAYEWAIIGAPADETGYRLDAALVCQEVKALNSVLVTAVMFEPREALPRQEAYFESRKEFYSAVPVDQWTNAYRERIQDIVRRNFGNRGEIIDIGVVTIPNTYTISSKDDAGKSSIKRAINYIVTNSNYRAKDFTPGVERFTLSEELIDNVDILANVIYHGGDITDEFGRPVRSDLRVEIKAEQVRNRRDRDRRDSNSLENNADMKIGAISAYADLTYVDDDTSNRRRDRFRMYDMNLHLTALTSEHRNTLESQLMVMGNIPMLIDEGVLGRSLLPSGDMAYLRNPSYLALDMPDDFPEIPENPSEDEWKDIMQTVVREDTTQIFLHVPETGLVSTIQETMVAAADPYHPNYETAYDELEAAAIRLTDGVYDPEDAPEFGAIETRRILLGTMTDSTGTRRDLREAQDYMTVQSYFADGQDTQLEQERWETAQYSDRVDEDFRLAMTETIVGQITDKEFRVSDRAVVVNINSQWLYYLSDCMYRAGLTIETEGIHEDYRGRRGGNYRSRYDNDGYRGGLFRRAGRRGSRRDRY